MGTDAFSSQRAEPFRYILLLPPPSTFTVTHKQQQVPPLHRSSRSRWSVPVGMTKLGNMNCPTQAKSGPFDRLRAGF